MVRQFSYRETGRDYSILAEGGISPGSFLELHVSLLMDGSDYMHIKGNKIWFVHRNFHLPEDIEIQGVNFDDLEWSDGESIGSKSSDITIPNGGNAGFAGSVLLTVIEARGEITIEQVPSEENQFETIILINDDPPLGESPYEFTIRLPESGFTAKRTSTVTTSTTRRALIPVSFRNTGIIYSSLPPSENLPIGIMWRLFSDVQTDYLESFLTASGWSFSLDAVPLVYREYFDTLAGWGLYEPFLYPVYEDSFSTDEDWSLYESFQLEDYYEPFDSDDNWTLYQS